MNMIGTMLGSCVLAVMWHCNNKSRSHRGLVNRTGVFVALLFALSSAFSLAGLVSFCNASFFAHVFGSMPEVAQCYAFASWMAFVGLGVLVGATWNRREKDDKKAEAN